MSLKLNRRLTMVSLVVAGAAAAVVAPLAASGDLTQRLYVGMNLHLTGLADSVCGASGTSGVDC